MAERWGGKMRCCGFRKKYVLTSWLLDSHRRVAIVAVGVGLGRLHHLHLHSMLSLRFACCCCWCWLCCFSRTTPVLFLCLSYCLWWCCYCCRQHRIVGRQSVASLLYSCCRCWCRSCCVLFRCWIVMWLSLFARIARKSEVGLLSCRLRRCAVGGIFGHTERAPLTDGDLRAVEL